jgi:hypothetical protein
VAAPDARSPLTRGGGATTIGAGDLIYADRYNSFNKHTNAGTPASW